jgi:hypothetical protein
MCWDCEEVLGWDSDSSDVGWEQIMGHCSRADGRLLIRTGSVGSVSSVAHAEKTDQQAKHAAFVNNARETPSRELLWELRTFNRNEQSGNEA